MTTRKTGGLHNGYKPIITSQRLKALALPHLVSKPLLCMCNYCRPLTVIILLCLVWFSVLFILSKRILILFYA